MTRDHATRAVVDAERPPAPRRRLAILDAAADSSFDEIVGFAATALGAPMAAISFVDGDRQWCKAATGLLDKEAGGRIDLCQPAVDIDDEVIVTDTVSDPRLAGSPMVIDEPRVRFYAGVPLHLVGEPVGVLCVLDTRPRELDVAAIGVLRFLARQTEHLLELHARRAAEHPPSRAFVASLATRLAAGEPFDQVLGAVDRAAWVFDGATLRFLAINDVAVERYGWSREVFLDRTILDIRPPADRRVLAAAIGNSDTASYAANRVWRHIRSDGAPIDVKITVARTTYEGRPASLAVVTDVTAQLHLGDALERAAHLDPLTGLANRRELLRTVEQRLTTEERIAVLVIDLDRFKLVNDTKGHDTGDALLAATGSRIRQHAARRDLVARIGGDEFAVVRSVRNTGEVVRFAEMIRTTLERPYVVDGGDHYVSASIGIAISDAGSTAQSLLGEADAAMYAAKDGGRNGCALFASELRREMADWSRVQRDLHRAIDADEMELDLQPIIGLQGGPIAYEALARWNHPTRGRLGPAEFIAVAEESGLIRRLGARLLTLAAGHAAELGAPVSANVSVHQFNAALVDQVAALIEQHGLSRGQLIIEVTESAVVDADHAAVVLDGLRAAGAHIWIDDFGTGYSSLARLGSLTVDGLKLPREFVNDLDSPRGRGIATAIVGIARALDIAVIAEGVETRCQYDQVRSLGCDAAQGFLLGRPRPFDVVRRRQGAREAVRLDVGQLTAV